jgi:hypothetical protein
MEDQFSDSSFEEANRLIHSAFNSPYAMNQAKNVAIRKQLLEAAIQKLIESKTFYISDVRDIAAMNNRPFDSRTKLYEQLNILNCREYRKMRPAVLELLPLMIHRATGISEQRFMLVVEANRVVPERSVATPAAENSAAAPASTAAPTTTPPVVQPADTSAAGTGVVDGTASPANVTQSTEQKELKGPAEQAGSAASPEAAVPARPWPLLLSLGLNLVLGAALLVSLQQFQQADSVARSGAPDAPAGTITPVALSTTPVPASPKSTVIDSVIRTASPASSLAQIAAGLPVDKSGSQQYVIGVRIEKTAN